MTTSPDNSYQQVLRLRTRLTALLVITLGFACLIIGVSSYLTLHGSLYTQYEGRLQDAVHRATESKTEHDLYDEFLENHFAPLPPVMPTECSQLQGKGLLDAPGQEIGTLSLCEVDGEIITSGVLDSKGRQAALSGDDIERLLQIADDGRPVELDLDTGEYLVASLSKGESSVVVIGIPLIDMHRTLAVLASVIATGSVAAMVFLGWFGTTIIRRTMKPLERVSAVATDIASLDLATTRVPQNLRVEYRDTNPSTEVGSVGYALNQLIDNVDSALASRQRTEDQMRIFVADASHELRTPLAAIKGYADLLGLTEKLTADGEKSLERIDSQTARMSRLIEDLLLLARLDEGREPVMEDVDLTELMLENVLDFQVAAPEHRWMLDLPEEPLEVRGDRNQLQQVIMNLLSNARKHTDEGTTITAGLRVENGQALMSVADNGAGMEPEVTAKIFDRFSRADKARSGSDGTTGLGLPIAKAIVEAHHGSIEVASAPGHTVFTVKLPLA